MRIRWGKPQYRVEIERRHEKGASWFWRIVSVTNGQTLATSETYSDRSKCEQSAANVACDAGWEWADTVKAKLEGSD